MQIEQNTVRGVNCHDSKSWSILTTRAAAAHFRLALHVIARTLKTENLCATGYIEHRYFKRFGRERPAIVLSIEEKIRRDRENKAHLHEEKLRRRAKRDGGREALTV